MDRGSLFGSREMYQTLRSVAFLRILIIILLLKAKFEAIIETLGTRQLADEQINRLCDE
jgi:hypothetical protein